MPPRRELKEYTSVYVVKNVTVAMAPEKTGVLHPGTCMATYNGVPLIPMTALGSYGDISFTVFHTVLL